LPNLPDLAGQLPKHGNMKLPKSVRSGATLLTPGLTLAGQYCGACSAPVLGAVAGGAGWWVPWVGGVGAGG